MAAKVKIEGIKTLKKQLQNLIKAVEPAKVEPITMEAAEMMADGIRKKAPQGPTGNLKKSVNTKQLKRRGKNPAPAIAAVDRKKYVGAPHAHLVDQGSKGVRIGKKGAKKYIGKSFGIMPKSGFFRKGVRNTQKKALHHVVTKLQALIEGAAK